MLVSSKNLIALDTDFDFKETIYVHKKWAKQISDLLCQLMVLNKMNENFIIHTYVSQKAYDKNIKEFVVCFRQEDNKDVYCLKLLTNNDNEFVGLDFDTYIESKFLIKKIHPTKTIKYLSFSFGKKTEKEHCYCKTVKSSVEFLSQLVKYV